MKTCTTCGIEKELNDFYNDKHMKDGKTYGCKLCMREKQRKYNKANPKSAKPKQPRMEGFRKLPEGLRKCGNCKSIKPTELFYKDSTRASGVSSKCKECQNDYLQKRRMEKGLSLLEVRRTWAEKNKKKLRYQDEQYRKRNRVRVATTEARRRARKELLPDTLTFRQTEKIIEGFNERCAVCLGDFEHLDHFIPIATGHGGTTKGNTIPLCARCNRSKHMKNPFEWRNLLSCREKKNFDLTVEYLSEMNGMKLEEYKDYVHACFKNKERPKTLI